MANQSASMKRSSPKMSLKLKIPRRSHSPSQENQFEISLMPRDKIFKRSLYPWSVHHSLTTTNWIATLSRPEEKSEKTRFQQYCFPTEKAAKRFCKAYAPPKMKSGDACAICEDANPLRHCRNCGVTICDRCSTRWGSRMCPKTYNLHQTITVRVCKSCDWLSNAFCLALLKGRYQDALTIYSTGNVNLRTSFADIRSEAMFPIHCAVMGGSIELVRWLIETHDCPISVQVDPRGQMLSVQTSASRTLMDLAMTGRVKTEILTYLISKGLSIEDAKDKTLAPRCLQAILSSGMQVLTDQAPPEINMIEDDDIAESVTTIDDPCALCCDRSMDCVLNPCGHQLCCSDCGEQLKNCPVCKASCQVLRVYRS